MNTKCIKREVCSDSYTTSQCFDIMNLQRPATSRSLNCTSDPTCKTLLYNYNWKEWCDNYMDAEEITIFDGCEGDFAQTFCPEKTIPDSCQNYVDYTNGLVIPCLLYTSPSPRD